MTQFKVSTNMNDVQAPSNSFEPLPVGEYLCEILSADVKPTSTPGRNQIVISLKVEEPVDFRNRRIFDRRNLPLDNEGPESFIAQNLRELFDAVPGSFDFETGAGDTDMMVNQRVMVRTRNTPDSRPDHAGELQTRVARIYAPQDPAAENTTAPEETPTEAPAAAPAAPAKAPAKAATPVKAPAKPAPAKAPAKVAAPAAAPVARSPFRRPAAPTQ